MGRSGDELGGRPGLIEGSNGLLRPQANASRAEVAAILMRFAQKIAK